MKKSVLLIFILLVSISFVSAKCDLDAELINQDPYPALPGDSVKVVFQLNGIEDPSCGKVRFALIEEYPFSLDPGAKNAIEINSGTFVSDYKKYLLAPYKLRVDKDAVEGENAVKVLYSLENGGGASIQEEFNITVEDSRTEFEIHVKDYDADEKRLLLEVLNVGESDAEAVTLEIRESESIELLGSARLIVGEIDSNEEEVATFEGEFEESEIEIKIIYTDQIGERRMLEESVDFDPRKFPKAKRDSFLSAGNAFIIGVLIPIVVYFVYKRAKKKKERHRKHLIKRRHGL